MNKEQQVPEDQQAAKPAMKHARNKNVSIRHKNTSKFSLIPHPLRHQMTCWKYLRMTHLIRVQGKTKQAPLHTILK